MNQVTCVVCSRELEVDLVREGVSYACSSHVAGKHPAERVRAMSALSRKHGLSALSLVSVEDAPTETEAP